MAITKVIKTSKLESQQAVATKTMNHSVSLAYIPKMVSASSLCVVFLIALVAGAPSHIQPKLTAISDEQAINQQQQDTHHETTRHVLNTREVSIPLNGREPLQYQGTGTNGGSNTGGSRQQSRLPQMSGHNGASNGNRCQSGWMWFNNKCWVTTQSRRDFVHAAELCKKMYNSTLPTIHSDDENEFLRQNIDLHNSPIWLYARHNHQYNKTRWLDKSPVNYTRWDVGQPSDKSSLVCIKTEESWYMKKADTVDGQTECVSFWEDAKWGTQVGCLVLLPVVCERKLTPISRYTDGPNGTISQYEQQQYQYPLSAGQSLLSQGAMNSVLYNGILAITLFWILRVYTLSEKKI